ncbi:acyl-CoA dehydrogenase [Micromonospora sp. ATCC 39149]|uniref:Acyl-CoA dehydrogenase family protein n=1 Tax=Micromonospora carbonacea TaxID=47853 RepID=A0A7D6CBV5_9ACTN|nr:acyl-CoA dehydrogenase family protein [Micromonospora sp. ATCC 39149]EEP69897.1 acyl-CoA dehydrogenase [Micromonospora sp. ATCC 39149]QLJ96363.1 acyl-CoA dehydrogenase family protein [Micromonospora carbonacea]
MPTTTEAPTREELVQRAADLVPLLRKHAAWQEENRRLHDETVAAIEEAGLFKLRTPRRYGGYEVDARTLVAVATELGRGDASTAWVTSVLWIPTWLAGLFPDEAQDEVFGVPNARVCGTNSVGGTAVPTDGGIVVNGSWHFISGAHHAQWQEIAVVVLRPDAEPEPIMALAPIGSLEIVDDWYTTGLSATGSVTTVARDLFVPTSHIIPMSAAMIPQGLSQGNADSPVWQTPAALNAAASGVGAAVGVAKAARDEFFDRLPGRKITYTEYENQSEAPITHLKVGTALMKIDQAEFHAYHAADIVDSKAASGAEWSLEERARVRADHGWATRLAKEAVDIFASASGGTSIYRDVPIQRIARDVNAMSLHGLINPDTNTELYGRVVCGLGPNTMFF